MIGRKRLDVQCAKHPQRRRIATMKRQVAQAAPATAHRLLLAVIARGKEKGLENWQVGRYAAVVMDREEPFLVWSIAKIVADEEG